MRHPRSPTLTSILLACLSAGVAGPAVAQTTTLRWEGYFPDSGVVTPVSVNGVTVDARGLDPFGIARPGNFQVSHDCRGLHCGYWRMDVNASDATQHVTFTFTFAGPVRELSFTILDLDLEIGARHESLTTVGWNGATALAPTTVQLGAGVANPAPGAFSGRSFCWPDNSTDACNAAVRFDQPVDSVTFVYGSGPQAPPDPGEYTAGISDLTWLTEADLVVSKTGPPTADAAQTISYRVTVRNDGPAAATGVVIIDSLPTGVEFVGGSDGAVVNGRVVTWPLATLGAGDSVTRVLDGLAPPTGPVTNVAAATSAAHDPESGNSNGTAPASRVTSSVTEWADLVGLVDGPATVGWLGAASYAVTVRNDGPSPASNVVVTATLPGALAFVGASNGGTEEGGVVSWPALPSLAAGAAVTFTVDATAQGTGVLTTVAAAASSTLDPDPANNNGTALTTVSTQADLVVVADGPTSVNPTETFTYTVTVRNDGPSPATGVLVTDTVSGGVTVIAVSQGGTASGGVATWPALDALAPGATQAFTLTVTASTGGTLLNVAAAAAATADPDPGSNDGSAPGSRVVTAVGAIADLLGAAVDEVLGTLALTDDQRRFLDREGNQDGVYDLGDLLALLERSGATLDDATMQRLASAGTVMNARKATSRK